MIVIACLIATGCATRVSRHKSDPGRELNLRCPGVARGHSSRRERPGRLRHGLAEASKRAHTDGVWRGTMRGSGDDAYRTPWTKQLVG